MALIQLGPFQFSVSTAEYDALHRRAFANWARLPILGEHERLHAVGNANDVVVLSGTLYPEYAIARGGTQKDTQTLDTLREMQAALVPYLMTAASGRNLEYWVIESVQSQDSYFIEGGTPRKQQFQITLRYYGSEYP